MKLVIQRVSQANVSVEGKITGSISRGLVVFICIEKGDGPELIRRYARKLVELRIFADDAGKMNLSVQETGGEVLLISQFTLAANVDRGRRPGFESAAPPGLAEELYRMFADEVEQLGVKVKTGVFRAYMQVSLVNDGPVTILMGG
jgi:D-tyrosyl-tRNA(Tyr) deacylase